MIYDDGASQEKAMVMAQRLAAQFGEELPIACESWKLSELTDPASARAVSEAVLKADILLFAMSRADLPPEARLWLESLAAPKGSTDRALAVLFTGPVARPESSDVLLSRLREAAGRLRMDFLPPMPAVDWPELDALQERVCTVTTVLKDILDRPRYDHWGLNE
ncbi:MAG: hypothetical protein U1F98_11495 [Verrucomicrobiota bacterium]